MASNVRLFLSFSSLCLCAPSMPHPFVAHHALCTGTSNTNRASVRDHPTLFLPFLSASRIQIPRLYPYRDIFSHPGMGGGSIALFYVANASKPSVREYIRSPLWGIDQGPTGQEWPHLNNSLRLGLPKNHGGSCPEAPETAAFQCPLYPFGSMPSTLSPFLLL